MINRIKESKNKSILNHRIKQCESDADFVLRGNEMIYLDLEVSSRFLIDGLKWELGGLQKKIKVSRLYPIGKTAFWE